MRRGTRTKVLIGLVVAIAVVLAACTDSGFTPSASTDSTDSTGSAVSPDTDAAGTATSAPASSNPTDTGATSPDAPAPEPEQDPNVRVGTLANGLTYYIRNNDNPGGSAELRLAIDAGSGREQPDQSGVAHFLEHMLFNGTEQFPENELIDVLRSTGTSFGADVNAYTSYDETVYQLKVPTGDDGPLDTGLDVLAQWLSAATLDPGEVESERGVVLDEWRNSQESARGRVGNAIADLFLAGSPYEGQSPIGTDTAISAMTPELLRRFYDEWYRPDNAAVVVVGAIDVDAVEAGITARFDGLQPRGGEGRGAPLTVAPGPAPAAVAITDPEITQYAVELTLPVAGTSPSLASLRDAVIDQLAFAMIATRLSDDATRSSQPFTDAFQSDNDLVRLLDAASVVVNSEPERATESMLALLDEFERAQRFGFDPGEVQRAVNEGFTAAQADYDQRDTVQDANYADQYAQSFLSGAPIITEQATFDVVNAALNSVTAEEISAHFTARWARTAPRLMAIGPDGGALPSTAEMLAAIADLPNRELVARPPTVLASGELMDAPAPVAESDLSEPPAHPEIFLEPVQLTFPNGVRVIIDNTPIVAGSLVLFGRSPGGMASVADADVADAAVAVDVVTSSGVGAFGQIQLEQQLTNTSASVSMSIGDLTDDIYASSSADDLESLLQLIHLYMTAPRVDDVALGHTLTELQSIADDPDADPASAGYDALSRARYGDDLRYRSVLTGDELATVAADDIAGVWAQRFGNASDWTFAIVGDVDLDDVSELARTYLGTLPGTGVTDPTADIVPPPPPGVVTETVMAGTGAKADVLRLYSVDEPDTPETAMLADVAGEIVSALLLRDIREALGESYSPSAGYHVTSSSDGGDAHVDLIVEISTSPELVGELVDRLRANMEGLVTEGPSDDDIAAAVAVIEEQYNYVNNESLADALLSEALGVGLTTQGYIDRFGALIRFRPDDIIAFLRNTLPPNQYIEIQVLPR